MPPTRRLARLLVLGCLALASGVQAALNAEETATQYVLANDRLVAAVNKSTGSVNYLTLDGQDLLGKGIGGPYLDCYCIPSGAYTPGKLSPRYQFIKGVDSSNTPYAGVVMSETYPPTGQILEQYWFLRDSETGLHMFSRLAYHNSTTPFLRNLQEFRTLFRPNTPLWTHLSTNADFYAPQPIPNPAATGTGVATVVQDATWDLSARPSDPYVEQVSKFFTKYTFQDTWRDHDVHGMFADGSNSKDNSTFGAWMVMNTKDTYFGGPVHSDLVVDGIVYNYIVSNHHGDQTPNITDGFDRTFGPYYYYFNKGAQGGSLNDLRNDAAKYANPSFAADFYDSIAQHVPNYVPSDGRGSWQAKVNLPKGAIKPIAVLSQNGVDFQDNVQDTSAYQYWADINPTNGKVSIDRVKAGTYRLTVYADGIFGDFIVDGVVIEAGKQTDSRVLKWDAESAGKELWRIGTPDRSSGEYRHGYAPDPTHPLHPPEYRIYFAAYDFIHDFPNGVNFSVGKSSEAQDFNYVHWSVFGGYGNSVRTQQVEGQGKINNWTISFDVSSKDLKKTSEATFTVQLAGAKTAAGNTDVFNATQLYNDLPFVVSVNGKDLEPWVIP
jgi:rhamnogalacturonan endolyase